MVPITVPIPGTIVPAAPPRSAPEIVRFLSAQALVCSHTSAGLVSASLVLAGLVLAGLGLSLMLLPSVFWKSAWMLAHSPHRRDVAVSWFCVGGYRRRVHDMAWPKDCE